MIRVGLIGHGALAGRVIKHLRSAQSVEVSGVMVRSLDRVRDGMPCVDSIAALLDAKPDVVIESAGQVALQSCAAEVLSAGVNLVPASIGAFVDPSFLASVLSAGAATGAQVRLPSGAIVGIDGLAAARHGGIDSVLYRGTMTPDALKGYVPSGLPARALVFSGTAREAVGRFPKNVNLTGTIALAGIGFERTLVELYVDPEVTANVHELRVTGDFGEFSARVLGLRISDESPTSRLVAGSLAQAALGSNFTLIAGAMVT